VKFADDFTDRKVSKSDSLSADFMVLSPFPMVIITMILFPGAGAMRLKSKRFLAQRISLAERFGNFMPVIVIVPNEENIQFIQFADMVFSADKLPDFKSLGKAIKLNPVVQTILRNGEPMTASFSSESNVEVAWDKALSLEDLSSNQSAFPRNTLARRLQEILAPLKEVILAKALPNANEQRFHNLRTFPRQITRRGDSASLSWTHSKHLVDEFHRALFQYIAEKCGGKVELRRYRDPLLGWLIERYIWKSETGVEVVIRRLAMSEVVESIKTRELVAEAWMTRAFGEPPVRAQVLLVGTTGTRDAVNQTISGIRQVERKPVRLGIQHVNALEAAGWLVAPWDFAEDEPKFIKFLKEVDHV
jgi:hypothetical protein